MGRFKYLVDSLVDMEGFKAKYHILQGVALRYCAPDRIVTNKREGEVVIPMIIFIEGGMMLPMGRVTQDYLINHRLCPHQCARNLFRVLSSINALNEQMGLRLTWHDVIPSSMLDITSSLDLTLLSLYCVFPSLIRV